MIKSYRHLTTPKLSGLTPIQVAQAYNFPKPTTDMSKQSIAILELGGSFTNEGIYAYCDKLGVKRPLLTKIILPGAIDKSDGVNGSDGEVQLDVEIIAAIAPGIHIIVVFAPNTDEGFTKGVQKCLDQNPTAISISWGSPENDWTSLVMATLDGVFQQAQVKQIPVFAAAGDDGSSDGEKGLHCDYPASSKYVVACGGTRLTLNPDGSRAAETTWSDGGGGIALSKRYSPDIAGNADPDTGYIISIDGEIQQIGGTSAVAPLMAGMYALMKANKPTLTCVLPQAFFQYAQDFFDVIKGGNGAYRAGVGDDLCTGLGVPNGLKLMKDL